MYQPSRSYKGFLGAFAVLHMWAPWGFVRDAHLHDFLSALWELSEASWVASRFRNKGLRRLFVDKVFGLYFEALHSSRLPGVQVPQDDLLH